VPVSADTFNLPARRAKFSAMSNERISAELGIRLPDWENDLEEVPKRGLMIDGG